MQDTVKDTIKDRLSSPIVGTFIIAYLAQQWEAILRVYFENGLGSKIELVKTALNDSCIFKNAVWITLGYVLIIPLFQWTAELINTFLKGFFDDWRWQINIKRKSSDHTVVRVENIAKVIHVLATITSDRTIIDTEAREEVQSFLKSWRRLESLANRIGEPRESLPIVHAGLKSQVYTRLVAYDANKDASKHSIIEYVTSNKKT